MISRYGLVYLLLMMLTGLAYAQDAEAPADEAAPEPVETAKDVRPPSLPPGPEIMRPTAHGFTLSPKLIDLFAGKTAGKMERDMNLSPDQKAKVQEAMAKRFRDMQRQRGNDAAGAFEGIIETILESDNKLTPESARHLAERLRPALSIIPEFFDGFRDDLRPVLNDEQFKEFSKEFDKGRKHYEDMQRAVDRWAKGDIKPGEQWNRMFEGDEASAAQSAPAQGSNAPAPAAAKPEASAEMQQAETRANTSMFGVGPEQWSMFLFRAKQVFGFSNDQFTAGQKILESYREKAKPVMTDEWRQRVRRNRIKSHAETLAGKEPIAPWMYHLEREYRELVKPLSELGRSFRGEVLALATDQQRAKVLAELQKFGTDHGMAGDDLTAETLHLTASRPSAQSQPENH